MSDNRTDGDGIPCLCRAYEALLPQKFSAFAPFAPARDRAFWRGLPTALCDELALRLLSEASWQPITAMQYLAFSETGNRVQFEDRYFNRRNLLSTLALAACIAEDGAQKTALLREVVNGVFLVCEESGWQLPPHNSYDRDLFACETGAQLALVRYLLKEELDGITPLITKRIEDELRRRIMRPYLTRHFWWQGNGAEPMCNWTPWCTQNVLLVAFLLPCWSEEERHAVVRQALYSSDCFLKDYGDDGCCSEGPEYYRHAGLCLCNVIDILCAVTGGALSPLFAEPKIRHLADYIVNMHVPQSDYYFNFADASAVAGKGGAREFIFGKRVQSGRLCAFAAEEWRRSSVQEKLLGLGAQSRTGCNCYYVLQALSAAPALDGYQAEDAATAGTGGESHIWYESIGVFIVHTARLSVAAKAGCNADSHNHNDTGSFIIYKDSKPLIIDIGVESYTKKTFSAERYDIWTMQSAWHNLPSFGGIMQRDGAQFRATDVRTKSREISMNIAAAYPAEAGLSAYRRTLTVAESGDAVRVCDSCRFADGGQKPVALSLLFSAEPHVTASGGSNRATIAIGSSGSVLLSSPQDVAVAVERVEITDGRLKRAWQGAIYRAIVTFCSEITLDIA